MRGSQQTRQSHDFCDCILRAGKSMLQYFSYTGVMFVVFRILTLDQKKNGCKASSGLQSFEAFNVEKIKSTWPL